VTTNDVIKIQIKGRPYDLLVEEVRAIGEEEPKNEKEDGKSESEPGAADGTVFREERGISITDTDLNVDLEGLKIGASLEELELGGQKEGSVNKDEHVYYTVVLPEFINGSYLIELHLISGDADLYVSAKERNPSQTEFTWSAQQKGTKKLTLSSSDPKFIPGRYYIGVHGFQPATFSISVSLFDKDEGQTLGAMADTQNGDIKICPNCRRGIPAGALMLHEAQCVRRNFRCAQCGEVMPVDQKDKHLAVAHSKLRCECGAEFEQDLLPIHKEFECPRRLVTCVYCGMELPYNERFTHQNDCGSRTATCPHCTKIFKRRDMKTHIVETHQIYPDNENFV